MHAPTTAGITESFTSHSPSKFGAIAQRKEGDPWATDPAD